MPTKHKQTSHRLHIFLLACLAIAFFTTVAHRFRFAEFELSTLTLMSLLLGMFTLAVALMYWKIIYPMSQKLSEKDLKKIFR